MNTASTHVHCSYQVDFNEGSPIRYVKYYVNSAICENMGLDYVLMPSVWSSPDQRYTDNLLDVLGDLVKCLQVWIVLLNSYALNNIISLLKFLL